MPLILGANSVRDTGYNVANSCRFESGDSDNLSRTNVSSVTNQFKWTFSFWVKLSDLFASRDGNPFLLSDFTDSNNRAAIFFESDDTLRIADRVSGSFTFEYRTNRKFRDTSNFYHIVVNHDRTVSSPATEVYVNGVQETSFQTSTNPSQNGTSFFNKASQSSLIGKYGGGSEFFNGYICEAVWIDGQALDATSFGEFDDDSPTHWKPKDVSSLTFGNNGFYLDFEDSSSLGKDVSGNSNNFTVNNLTALNQTTDTCTNNFCTFTQSDPSASNFTLTEGNCKVNKSGSGAFGLYGTNIMLSKGKWYWEVKFTADAGSDRTRAGVAAYESVTGTSTIQGSFSGFEFTCNTGGRFSTTESGSTTEIDGFNQYSTGDIIRFALDMDNQRLYIGRNGDFFNYSSSATGGDPSSGSGFVTNSTTVLAAPVTPYAGHSVGVSGTSTLEYNFGNPTFSISSGNSDSEGFGNFEFAVPSGYFAICTKNLAEYGG